MGKLAHGWTFEWHYGRKAYFSSPFYDEWTDLFQNAASVNIFQHPVMVRIWIESRGEKYGVKPAFLLARNPAGDKIVIPFCLWPGRLHNGFRRRLIPAGQPNFDYQDPLLVCGGDAPFAWDDFWSAFGAEVARSRWFDYCELLRVRSGIASCTAQSDSAVASPVIDFQAWEGLDAFMAGLGGDLRRDVNRRLRRFDERGTVRFKVFGPGESQAVHQEWIRMRHAYRKEWSGTPSSGILDEPSVVEFYSKMVSELTPPGFLHFSVLSLDNRPVSWVFGFLFRGIYHFYKPVYDPDYAALSPGKIHCFYLIRKGFEDGWKMFDFGAGLEDYKLLWTRHRIELEWMCWRSENLRGRVCDGVRRVRSRLE